MPKRKSVHTHVSDVQVSREDVAPESSDEIPIQSWTAEGRIICMSQGNRRILHENTLKDLLDQLKDGQGFRLKDLRLTRSLGPSEFNLAINWMRAQGLVTKEGRTYTVNSIESVKRAWNNQITADATL